MKFEMTKSEAVKTARALLTTLENLPADATVISFRADSDAIDLHLNHGFKCAAILAGAEIVAEKWPRARKDLSVELSFRANGVTVFKLTSVDGAAEFFKAENRSN